MHTNTERMRTTENIFMICAAIAIGALGGFGAIGFRLLIHFIQDLLHTDWAGTVDAVAAIPWYYKLMFPTLGGAIVGPLVYFGAREAKGTGVPEVIESVALNGGRIRPRVILVKSLASAIGIGSGLSVGREGPITHIGSAIGSTLGQLFKVNTRRLRTFVGCGAAAGIAATFNAPIAGAIFTLEVILGDFAISWFSPIVISSVVATVISRHFLGDVPAFIVPTYRLVNPTELLFYVVLGIVTALVAVLFVKTLYKSEDYFDALKIPEWSKPAVAGLLIGVLALFYPHILGVGYEAIDMALFGDIALPLLITLVAAKILATSMTLGAGGSGGVFAPSLFIGSMVGGTFGMGVNQLYPELSASSGAYALVAMGAMVSATTRTPITSILIIFELTNDYTIILPLMITCILSTIIATYLIKPSVYLMKLNRRGVDIHKNREGNILRSLFVSGARSDTFETVKLEATLEELLVRLAGSTHSEFYIVGRGNTLQGVVTFDDIRNMLTYGDTPDGAILAYDLARTDIPSVTDDDTLDSVLLLFGKYNVDEFPVLDTETRKLIGVVDREHVMNAYNREVARRDLAGEFSSLVSNIGQDRVVELGDNYAMVEIEAPSRFVDQTIRQLRIRARYDVQVLLIKKMATGGTATHFVPGPDYLVEKDDILLLAGSNESVQRVRNV